MASNLRLLIPQPCPPPHTPAPSPRSPATPAPSPFHRCPCPCPPTWLRPAKETGLLQLIRVCHDAAGEAEPQSFHMRGKAWVTIGRSQQADVRLAHPTVSRWHAALLHADDGQLYVFDFGSAHGTRTFSKPLCSNMAVPIKPGAMLRFGDETGPLFLVKLCERIPFHPFASAGKVLPVEELFTASSPTPTPNSPPPPPPPPESPPESPPPLHAVDPDPADADSDAMLVVGAMQPIRADSARTLRFCPSPAAAADDDNPLSPHTMANTRLNTVLPSFVDGKRCRVIKRLLLGDDDTPHESSCPKRKRVSF